MKTWEALKAAEEGKKIRRRWWAASMYSFKDESRFCDPALITHYGTLGKESLEDLIRDNEKQIISNIICLKIFVFAFMALWVCVWYYIYGVHGFYKLWKRKGLLTSSPFLFGN